MIRYSFKVPSITHLQHVVRSLNADGTDFRVIDLYTPFNYTDVLYVDIEIQLLPEVLNALLEETLHEQWEGQSLQATPMTYNSELPGVFKPIMIC